MQVSLTAARAAGRDETREQAGRSGPGQRAPRGRDQKNRSPHSRVRAFFYIDAIVRVANATPLTAKEKGTAKSPGTWIKAVKIPLLMRWVATIPSLSKTHASAYLNRVAATELYLKYMDTELPKENMYETGNVVTSAAKATVSCMDPQRAKKLLMTLAQPFNDPTLGPGLVRAYDILADPNHGRLLVLAMVLHALKVFPDSMREKVPLASIAVTVTDFDTKRVLPDYTYDKHTAKGRSAGKGYAHFVEEGLKVNKLAVELPSKAGGDAVVDLYQEEASELYTSNKNAFGGLELKTKEILGLWQYHQKEHGRDYGTKWMLEEKKAVKLVAAVRKAKAGGPVPRKAGKGNKPDASISSEGTSGSSESSSSESDDDEGASAAGRAGPATATAAEELEALTRTPRSATGCAKQQPAQEQQQQ